LVKDANGRAPRDGHCRLMSCNFLALKLSSCLQAAKVPPNAYNCPTTVCSYSWRSCWRRVTICIPMPRMHTSHTAAIQLSSDQGHSQCLCFVLSCCEKILWLYQALQDDYYFLIAPAMPVMHDHDVAVCRQCCYDSESAVMHCCNTLHYDYCAADSQPGKQRITYTKAGWTVWE
jgi:hypothetical protein